MAKQITINNSEVERFINSHAAVSGNDFNEIVNRLLERAMKDMQYRSRRNAQKWQETKAMKEQVKSLEEKLAHLKTLEEIGRGHEELIDAE
jgi:hypothetical protein